MPDYGITTTATVPADTNFKDARTRLIRGTNEIRNDPKSANGFFDVRGADAAAAAVQAVVEYLESKGTIDGETKLWCIDMQSGSMSCFVVKPLGEDDEYDYELQEVDDFENGNAVEETQAEEPKVTVTGDAANEAEIEVVEEKAEERKEEVPTTGYFVCSIDEIDEDELLESATAVKNGRLHESYKFCLQEEATSPADALKRMIEGLMAYDNDVELYTENDEFFCVNLADKMRCFITVKKAVYTLKELNVDISEPEGI